jgi:hypothetical protein
LFTINGKSQTQQLFLTGLEKQKIILGFPWLQEQNPIINWRTGQFRWLVQVPDIKKIHCLTEQRCKNEQQMKELKKIPTENSERSLQQWKREREVKELKRIPIKEMKDEHKELNEVLVEETKDSQRVLKRRRNETNKKANKTTYISTIIEKDRSELQRRKEEAANIPNNIGNIDKPESSPKSEY